MIVDLEKKLAEFVALETTAFNQAQNQKAIDLLLSHFNEMGFEVSVEGESQYYQPVIVAKYTNPNSNGKVVIYGHYDVEPIKSTEVWNTPPFELTEKKGRLYGRGIADNKGVLLTRILALQEMLDSGLELPNILWVIQGEEEVEGETAFEVFSKHFTEFNARFYLEETGMHRAGQPLILFVSNTEKAIETITDLNNTLYNGEALVENRKLNKFSKCAFFENIPPEGIYLAFGPNDEFCNIHGADESLGKLNLLAHSIVFMKFIDWAQRQQLNTQTSCKGDSISNQTVK